MTLIDGDRIITAQLYDDEHEEFTEKKMSIVDYINAYTDEGITEVDVVEQTSWIPVSERLPNIGQRVLVTTETLDNGKKVTGTYYDRYGFVCGNVLAWMPLPKPYTAESEV